MVTILRDAGLSDADRERRGRAAGAAAFNSPRARSGSPTARLLFQDIKAERTYRLGPDRSVQLLREQTGAANGQTFGAGRFDRLLRAERPPGLADGSATARGRAARRNLGRRTAQQSQRHRLPVRRPCLFHRPALRRRAVASGRFTSRAFSPSTRRRAGPDALRLLADDFEKPNGLAFSPDERTLYVCDTGALSRPGVRRRAVDGSLRVGSSRVFARLDPGQPGGPDGMKVDKAGRVYVAVALGVWVFEPDGRLLGILSLPARPSNLAWCGADARGLAITAVDAVYHVRLRVEGIMPPFMPIA